MFKFFSFSLTNFVINFLHLINWLSTIIYTQLRWINCWSKKNSIWFYTRIFLPTLPTSSLSVVDSLTLFAIYRQQFAHPHKNNIARDTRERKEHAEESTMMINLLNETLCRSSICTGTRKNLLVFLSLGKIIFYSYRDVCDNMIKKTYWYSHR